MPITDAELDAMQARCDAATRVELARLSEFVSAKAGCRWEHNLLGDDGVVASFAAQCDQQFFDDARTDIPLLIAEVRRLRRHVALLDAVLKCALEDLPQESVARIKAVLEDLYDH